MMFFVTVQMTQIDRDYLPLNSENRTKSLPINETDLIPSGGDSNETSSGEYLPVAPLCSGNNCNQYKVPEERISSIKYRIVSFR